MDEIVLSGLADWHGCRAMKIWGNHWYEKNHDRLQQTLRDFTRHCHYHDLYRRLAFLASKKGKH